jgi:hypothetical protein
MTELTSAEIDERKAKLLAEEVRSSGGKTTIFYLSFVDERGFLGGIWTRAIGPIHALRRTHELGINPGGEVMIVRVPTNAPASAMPPPDYYDRLVDLETLKRILGPGEIATVPTVLH